MAVKVAKDNVAAILAAVNALTETQVLVGIPSDAPARGDDEGDRPLTNAELGYIHEFGAPEANIPARPFLLPGVENARAAIAAEYRHAAEAALDGRNVAEAAHLRVGITAQNAVRAKITEGPFAPLAERTLKRRKARGRKGESPLIDTGQMRASVTFSLSPRKG